MNISSKKALSTIQSSKHLFKTLFEHGSLRVEVYKPEKEDLQQPHDQDEVYVVISGNGKFKNGEKHIDFTAGDFLFVPAGVEHHFYDFTEDFVTWVFFYGPKGGETN